MQAGLLNLIVLRVSDLAKAKRFYHMFGIQFTCEQHGFGPENYAADVGGVVFEIYPCGDKPPSGNVRLGFNVRSMADVSAAAGAMGAAVQTPPASDAQGIRAVFVDPDGNRVEIRQRT